MWTKNLMVALALCVGLTMADKPVSSALKVVADGNALFNVELFKKIAAAKPGENIISSPLSAHTVLAMAAYGAKKNTAAEMQKGLHLASDEVIGRQGYQNLIEHLNSVNNVTLELANKIYVNDQVPLKDSYRQLAATNFYSDASPLNVAKPKEAAAEINQWVKDKTHNKIDGIIQPDAINHNLAMVLLNAVYFKGAWGKAFKKELTKPMVFNVDAQTQKHVDTMSITSTFHYGELPDLKAKFIELPYQNKNVKMVIIVPDEIDGLKDVINNLEHFNASRLAKSGYDREVHLYLPKFKINTKIDLNDPLKALGMEDMFSPTADFSGMTDKPVYVSKVTQKAFIEVNEEGSEAAAVTAIKMVPLSAPLLPLMKPTLRIDRPFLFRIFYAPAKMTLFTGSISKP
ncbi:alaserpin-like isoform X4 [Trichogramma pretiosum]|uniref:alaserpin-like isoform X4 n=1 Tax=Trichogramma pretiosum TaxID=7493 RepID=UPI0006C93D18|nr:alaserpin-like isoform X4 [Trichogramma pretiosum]